MKNKITTLKRASLFLLLFLSIFYLTACEIKEFVAPSWDVQANVPIFNKAYTVKEIIEKDTSFVKFKGATSILYYADSKSITPIRVNDDLKITPTVNSVSQALGAVVITPPADITDSVPITKWANVTPGQTQVFPAVANAMTEQTIQRLTAFQTATFDAGTMNLVFKNNNGPVAISLNRIIVRDAYTGMGIVSNLTPVNVPANSEVTIPFDMANKTFVDSLTIESWFSSAGSSGVPVFVPADASTKFTVQFRNLVVASVTGQVPQQNPIVKSSTVKMDDSTSFRKVIFGAGSLNLNLTSGLDVPMTVSVSIAEIKKPDGSTFVGSTTLPRKGTGKITIPSLTDYTMQNAALSLTNQLTYTVTANNIVTPNSVSTITKNDLISTQVVFSELVMQQFTGKVKPTQLQIKETNININLKDLQGKFKFGMLNLADSDVKMRIMESSSYQMLFTGKLMGTNGVQTRELVIPQTLLSQSGSDVVFSSSTIQNFLNGFVTYLPDKITVRGVAIVNPNFVEGSIVKTDSVYGATSLNFPFNVGIKDGTFEDSTSVEIPAGDTARINNIVSAKFTTVLTNGLPVSIEYAGDFYGADGKILLHFPPNRTGTDPQISLAGGVVDATGRVVTPSVNTETIDMTGADFKMITKAKYIKSRIKVNTSAPNTAPVKFYTSDAVNLRAFGTAKYKLDLNQ